MHLIKRLLVAIAILVVNSHCQAADLIDVYHKALECDTTFRAAYSTYLSKTETIPQARSALLPQLGITSIINRTALDVQAPSFVTNQTYDSTQMTLNASQAIFNLQAWAQVKQAKASVKAALAEFNDATQDLILRVSQAYLDILFSKDTLNFAEAKKRANKRQLNQAKERFDAGIDTITTVYEAKAAYDQSVAEVISAQNNQINQSENLRKLTNQVYDHLSPLRNSLVPLIKPEPNNVDDWIAAGLKQNYKLFSATFNLQAARENIKVQSTSNWPSFALQGTSSQTHNDTKGNANSLSGQFFAPTKITQSSVGVTMNFPAYQGGLTESQTRQAQYDYQTSAEQLEHTYRDVIVNSRIAFNTIVDGISKVRADRQTVLSQRRSLESTEDQFLVGTRTMVDVVGAQQRLFEAQEQLASDQYKFIMSILKLKYLAGSLSVSDIEEVNAWMDTTRINRLPRR